MTFGGAAAGRSGSRVRSPHRSGTGLAGSLRERAGSSGTNRSPEGMARRAARSTRVAFGVFALYFIVQNEEGLCFIRRKS